jgi:hypothetical protein
MRSSPYLSRLFMLHILFLSVLASSAKPISNQVLSVLVSGSAKLPLLLCACLHFVMQSVPVAVLAVFFMMFMTIVFLFPTTPQTSVQEMNYTVVVLVGVLLLSLVWYYFPIYGGMHWFTGPIANIDTRSPSLDETRSIDSEKDHKPGKMV